MLNRHIKALVPALIVLLLFQNSAGASCTLQQTLSPPLSVNSPEFKEKYKTACICSFVEREGCLSSNSGLMDAVKMIEQVSKREKDLFTSYGPYEIVIDVPEEKMAVRYFDPANAPVITPFTDIARLRTKTISQILCRQIIYRTEGIAHSEKQEESGYFLSIDKKHLSDLKELADQKVKTGEIDPVLPVLARIVDVRGEEVVTACRTKLKDKELTAAQKKYKVDAAHAELTAIREAEKKGFSDWEHSTIYVNLSPCHNCNKMLTEYYNFKRIVFSVEDKGISREENIRNKTTCSKNNTGRVRCDDPGIIKAEEKRFERSFIGPEATKRKRLFDAVNKMLDLEQVITECVRDKYRRFFGKDIQVLVFDADTWDAWRKDEEMEELIFRHICWLKMRLNPRKKHILIISGSAENAVKAKNRITGEGIIPEGEIWVTDNYRAEKAPDSVFRKDVFGKFNSGSFLTEIFETVFFKLCRYSITASSGQGTVSRKQVLLSQPFEGYAVPVFKIPEYMDSGAYNLQYRIAMAAWRGEETDVEALISEIFPGGENIKKEYIEEKTRNGRKRAKIYLMEKLWEARGVVECFKKTNLAEHARREWNIITGLINDDIDFKASLANPYLEPAAVRGLYNKYFGKEFGSLKGDGNLMNLTAHMLLLHDVGKFGCGETGHEKKSEDVLSELFKENYFQMRAEEKNFIRRFAGFHTAIGEITREKNEQDFRKLVSETAREAFYKEDEMRDILKIWVLFRIAELSQSEHFSFIEEEDFVELRRVYEKADGIIKEAYGAEEPAGGKDVLLREKFTRYLMRNLKNITGLLGENKPAIMLRIPVEAVENMDREHLESFCRAFQASPNAYIRLFYMTGIEGASLSVYEKFGIEKKEFPASAEKDFKMSRKNTITLFPAFKGEEVSAVVIRDRLGDLNMDIRDSILSPVGLKGDPAGLVRSTVSGMRLMSFAREISGAKLKAVSKDSSFRDRVQAEAMESYKEICDAGYFSDLAGLTVDDVLAIIAGEDNNDIITALRKLIRVIPAEPVDAEELKRIYEAAERALRYA
ncbi:MAG: deaminase [Candidatus Omnitrophota bacterium]